MLVVVHPLIAQHWEWMNLPDMPTARYGHCSVIFQDKVWIIGGKSGLNMTLCEIDCFDLSTGQWVSGAPDMNNPRYNASAVVYQNKIFVIGGSGFLQNKLKAVEYFDPQSGNWHEFTPLNYEREGMTSVVLQDTLYVIGGHSNNGLVPVPLDIIEYWDQGSSSWKISEKWHLQTARVAMQSVVVDSTVFTFGGVSVAPLNQLEVFQSGSGSRLLNPSPRARFYFAGAAAGDTLFSFGGYGISGTLDSIDIYDIQNDIWTTWDITLTSPRAGLSAVNYKGDFYLFGGISESNGVLNIAQRLEYFPATAVVDIDIPNLPDHFGLLGNYPNPFNAGTTIKFQVAATEEQVQLLIFNILGKRVRIYDLGSFAPGLQQIHWNGCDENGRPVESGIYFAHLKTAKSGFGVLKMSLVK